MGDAVGTRTMDATRYLLREFRETDFDALAAIQNAVEPDALVSPDSLRHIIEALRRATDPYEVVVEARASGTVVATGSVFKMAESATPDLQGIYLVVHPSHQREGIGTFLYDTLVDRAMTRGASRLQCRVRENSAAGRAFAAKRQFTERRRRWRSSLDVATADTAQLPSLARTIASTGVELTTLSKEGPTDLQVLRKIHDLDSAAARDQPQDGTYTPVPFDLFRQWFFEGSSYLPEAWALAKQGDQYVGMSAGAKEPAQPKVLQQYFTGVRPEFRRRKIALALKLMVIDYAKRSGYARVETWNDSLNTPMWALNRSLGFAKVREVIQVEKDLRTATEDPFHATPSEH